MSFYSDMQAVANSLLTEFGYPVTLIKRTQGTFDAATGNVTGAAETQYTFNAVVLPRDEKFIDGKHYEWNDQFHSGTQIKLDETEFYLSPLLVDGSDSPTPAMGDGMLVDSVRYSITEVIPLNPAGTVMLYQVKARR